MYNSQNIAKRIKDYAKTKKISVSKMLTECELNKNTIFMMQSRASSPQANNLAKIADYLGCSVDYLLGRSSSPSDAELDMLNDLGKQKVKEYINDLKNNPQYLIKDTKDKPTVIGLKDEPLYTSIGPDDDDTLHIAAFGKMYPDDDDTTYHS